LIIRDKK